MAAKKKNELVIVKDSYPMVNQDANAVLEAIKENFAGEKMTSRDIFKEIPSPSAGDEHWMIETPDGKNSYDELTGVILFIGNTRALFEGEYGIGSDIPVCTSKDGIVAEGEPGGRCGNCDLKDFSEDGDLPECTQKKPVFLLVPEINPVLPVVINATATSFPILKKFRAGLTQFGIQPHHVQVKITLKAGKTKNNRDSSKLNFEIDGNLKTGFPEVFANIEKFRSTFMPYMNPNADLVAQNTNSGVGTGAAKKEAKVA